MRSEFCLWWFWSIDLDDFVSSVIAISSDHNLPFELMFRFIFIGEAIDFLEEIGLSDNSWKNINMKE